MHHVPKLMLSVLLAVAIPGRSLAETHCFRQADNDRLAYRIFHIARPPVAKKRPADPDLSAYYPGSDYATTTIDAARADRDANVYYLQWANRCIFMQGITPSPEDCRNNRSTKANGYSRMRVGRLDTQIRAAFSTYERADACTLLQVRQALGIGREAVAADAEKAGLSVFRDDPSREAVAPLVKEVQTGTGSPASYLVDICVLPEAVDARPVKGLYLDFEVFDGRLPRQTVAFLTRLKSTLGRVGLELVVNTNPLPREPNGMTEESARDVLDLADVFVIPISTGATAGNQDIGYQPRNRQQSHLDSYREQLSVLTRRGQEPLTPARKKKLVWGVALYDTALDEARKMRELFLAEGYGGIMLFRAYVKQGGACSRDANQLTACLAFGQCDGRFRP